MATIFINHATAEDLKALIKNIGDVKSNFIVKKRNELGGNFTEESLLAITEKGVSKTFAELIKQNRVDFGPMNESQQMQVLMHRLLHQQQENATFLQSYQQHVDSQLQYLTDTVKSLQQTTASHDQQLSSLGE
mgnify:CR=1 FL=1